MYTTATQLLATKKTQKDNRLIYHIGHIGCDVLQSLYDLTNEKPEWVVVEGDTKWLSCSFVSLLKEKSVCSESKLSKTLKKLKTLGLVESKKLYGSNQKHTGRCFLSWKINYDAIDDLLEKTPLPKKLSKRYTLTKQRLPTRKPGAPKPKSTAKLERKKAYSYFINQINQINLSGLSDKEIKEALFKIQITGRHEAIRFCHTIYQKLFCDDSKLCPKTAKYISANLKYRFDNDPKKWVVFLLASRSAQKQGIFNKNQLKLENILIFEKGDAMKKTLENLNQNSNLLLILKVSTAQNNNCTIVQKFYEKETGQKLPLTRMLCRNINAAIKNNFNGSLEAFLQYLKTALSSAFLSGKTGKFKASLQYLLKWDTISQIFQGGLGVAQDFLKKLMNMLSPNSIPEHETAKNEERVIEQIESINQPAACKSFRLSVLDAIGSQYYETLIGKNSKVVLEGQKICLIVESPFKADQLEQPFFYSRLKSCTNCDLKIYTFEQYNGLEREEIKAEHVFEVPDANKVFVPRSFGLYSASTTVKTKDPVEKKSSFQETLKKFMTTFEKKNEKPLKKEEISYEKNYKKEIFESFV